LRAQREPTDETRSTCAQRFGFSAQLMLERSPIRTQRRVEMLYARDIVAQLEVSETEPAQGACMPRPVGAQLDPSPSRRRKRQSLAEAGSGELCASETAQKFALSYASLPSSCGAKR
jgi:hypothetical protein